MSQLLQKTYQCNICQAPIKLERKDNHWLRWNLDGTAHIDQRKKLQKPQQQQSTATNTAVSPDASTEALLRLILSEQRTNFEKIDYTLTKLDNTLDALSTVISSIYEFQQQEEE